MTQPTLSVGVPNYNHGRYLGKALEAILAQSFQPIEIIIIDDASTDNSMEVIDEYARRDSRIRVIRNETNQGVNANLNRLLEDSAGDFFYGAAADDRVLPGMFEKQMRLLSNYPNAGLSSCLSFLMDEEDRNLGVFPTPLATTDPAYIPPEQARRLLLTKGSWLQGNVTIYRRHALIGEGGYLPQLHSYSDGFISEVLALRYGACYVPEPLGAWRIMERGFAQATYRDVRRLAEVTREAERLMRSVYRDIFSEEYIASWHKRRRRRWAIKTARGIQQEQKALVEALRLLEPTRRIDRRFIQAILLGASDLQSLLFQVLLTASTLGWSTPGVLYHEVMDAGRRKRIERESEYSSQEYFS